MSLSLDVVVLGVVTGLTYGILAVGLSLIYKSARFINFAHGNLGAFVAVIFFKLVVDYDVPYWIAFVAALAMGGGLGALVELSILRRLFDSPRLVLVVATIAISQLFLFGALQRSLQADQTALVTEGFPVPFEATITVGSLILDGGELAVLLVVPLLAIGLGAFLRFSPYGQAVRAAADNPDGARLAGISVRRMSTLVWIIAGLLATVTAILLAPMRSVFQVGALGPSILVRALGASLVGRMTNLPVAFGAGVALGVIEAISFDTFPEGGVQDLVVFLVVMAALAARARGLSRATRDADVAFTFGAEARPLVPKVAALPAVRRIRAGAVWGSLALAVVLPLLPILQLDTSQKTFLMTLVLGYAIVGLSLTLLTGWAGQVSLGHFALVGVGAFSAARFAGEVPLLLLVPACGLLGVVVAVVVGLPAVRIQGLFLAVSTLAFAVVAQGWAFQQDFLIGTPSGVSVGRPDIIGSERRVYWFALALLVLSALAVRNLRRSGPGRALIAVRDNDMAARSEGLSATGTRLLAFAVSGFMAAVAGVIFAYARGNFTASDFQPATSIDMLLMVIIGGLGSIPGAIIGACFLFGLRVIFGSGDLVRLATSGFGVLVVLLFLPGGLVSLAHRARDALAARAVRRAERRPPPPSLVPPLRQLWRVALARETGR